MKLSSAVKRQITEDWLRCFPDLGFYKPLWLLRRVGPLVTGICLERDSGNDAYCPTFHVHNLAKPSSTVSLTLATALRTAKSGIPEIIRVAFHQERFADAAEHLRRQASISLSGPVCLDDCLKAYRGYMRQPLGRYPLELFEDIVTLFIWCNQEANAQDALREFELTVSKWPENARPAGGADAWTKQCRGWIEDPDQIKTCVTTQVQSLGLEAVPHSDLLN